jgi:hypothetical protein
MIVQFLLFVIAVLLLSIFWELTKINNRLKTLLTPKKQDHDWPKQDAAWHPEAANLKNRELSVRLPIRNRKTSQDASLRLHLWRSNWYWRFAWAIALLSAATGTLNRSAQAVRIAIAANDNAEVAGVKTAIKLSVVLEKQIPTKGTKLSGRRGVGGGAE